MAASFQSEPTRLSLSFFFICLLLGLSVRLAPWLPDLSRFGYMQLVGKLLQYDMTVTDLELLFSLARINSDQVREAALQSISAISTTDIDNLEREDEMEMQIQEIVESRRQAPTSVVIVHSATDLNFPFLKIGLQIIIFHCFQSYQQITQKIRKCSRSRQFYYCN